VGKVSKGHVLDVSVKAFTEALKELDRRLYVRWNPEKLKGHGCWEIRIRPLKKTALYQGTFEGVDYYELDYLESDIIHHVLDCAFLNYDALRKLKEMDTTNPDHFIHSLEYDEQDRANKQLEKAMAERKYAIKQHRSILKDFYERVRSGENIHRIIGEEKWTTNVDRSNYERK